MRTKNLLIIGFVWPEPASSAAGTRMVQLVDLFLKAGHQVTFASAASKSEFSYDFSATAVTERFIKLNDESFNLMLKQLQPDVVIYDRFMVEEQYGWRVHQECPDALKILDTEDLHFLRHARAQSLRNGLVPDLFSDTAKREIASILRCDLSLIISKQEMQILKETFKIDASLLFYLPFLEEKITGETVKNWLPFEERQDFIFIGNFLHEPNWKTVQVLKTRIWPLLRKYLPEANLNIYGAYPSGKVLQLNNKKERFLVHGRALDARGEISKHRLMLAPIPFGAGVKGKLIDAMHTGTPSATTTAGAEGMKGHLAWNGIIEDDPELFAEKAARLYTNKDMWNSAQEQGIHIINEHYDAARFSENFISTIKELCMGLTEHRRYNFLGQLLMYHSMQSTKYLSLWIEEKNKGR